MHLCCVQRKVIFYRFCWLFNPILRNTKTIFFKSNYLEPRLLDAWCEVMKFEFGCIIWILKNIFSLCEFRIVIIGTLCFYVLVLKCRCCVHCSKFAHLRSSLACNCESFDAERRKYNKLNNVMETIFFVSSFDCIKLNKHYEIWIKRTKKKTPEWMWMSMWKVIATGMQIVIRLMYWNEINIER